MKKLRIFFFLLILSLSIVSCQTSSLFFVPGELRAREENIAKEYLSIAQSYEDIQNYTKALEYYTLVWEKSAKADNAVYYKMGRCYALLKDWQHASDVYKHLLETDKDNTNIKMSLAYIYAMSGDVEQAIQIYGSLATENVAQADVLKNYISVLFVAEKYAEAKETFLILKENFPDEAELSTIEAKIEEAFPAPALEADSAQSELLEQDER